MPRLSSTLLVELACPGRQSAIRPALARVRAVLQGRCAADAEPVIDDVELALAEVLNNIVEHAGASERDGAIRIAVRRGWGTLSILVSDDGRPLPRLRPPAPEPPDIAVPEDALPEGGFGWTLIDALTCGLCYRRTGGRNELALCFECRDEAGAPATAARGNCPEIAQLSPTASQKPGR